MSFIKKNHLILFGTLTSWPMATSKSASFADVNASNLKLVLTFLVISVISTYPISLSKKSDFIIKFSL